MFARKPMETFIPNLSRDVPTSNHRHSRREPTQPTENAVLQMATFFAILTAPSTLVPAALNTDGVEAAIPIAVPDVSLAAQAALLHLPQRLLQPALPLVLMVVVAKTLVVQPVIQKVLMEDAAPNTATAVAPPIIACQQTAAKVDAQVPLVLLPRDHQLQLLKNLS
jgi:hypothetical protein